MPEHATLMKDFKRARWDLVFICFVLLFVSLLLGF